MQILELQTRANIIFTFVGCAYQHSVVFAQKKHNYVQKNHKPIHCPEVPESLGSTARLDVIPTPPLPLATSAHYQP